MVIWTKRKKILLRFYVELKVKKRTKITLYLYVDGSNEGVPCPYNMNI